jgi:hypothetical protein
MIFLTTTSVDLDEELLNRSLVLTVDEGREQTRRIHRLQRETQTLDALFASDEKEAVKRRHANAQRLLRPLPVVNPFVRDLTFLDDRTRARRDHVKYLKLIESIALLHQHQRPVKSESRRGVTKEYVEATLSDIALANRLAAEVLGRSLDELVPQTRRLLDLLDGLVTRACEKEGIVRNDLRFSRKWVRERAGWTDFQLRVHLGRLVELEYLLVHRGARGQSYVYELLWSGEGRDGRPFVMGLADVAALAGTTETSRGTEDHFEGGSSPLRGAFEGRSSGEEEQPDPAPHAHLNGFSHEEAETPLSGPALGIPSYPPPEPKLLLRRVAGRL